VVKNKRRKNSVEIVFGKRGDYFLRQLEHKDLEYVLHKFEKALKEWELTPKADTTIRTYKQTIKKFNEYLYGVGTDLFEFGRIDVQTFVDKLLQDGKRATTINKDFAAITTFCKWMDCEEKTRGIRVVEMQQSRNTAPKALDDLEKNRLLREVERKGNKRDIAIVSVLLNCGLRVAELTSMKRKDVEMSERKGVIRVVGKGQKKEREVRMNSKNRFALTEYLDTRSDSQEAVFLSTHRKPISIRSVQTMLQKYGVHPHALRHTFVTALVRNGEDFSLIQSLTGHKSADMVMRYSRPTIEEQDDAVERL
jgi:integrase/recombinase XerD